MYNCLKNRFTDLKFFFYVGYWYQNILKYVLKKYLYIKLFIEYEIYNIILNIWYVGIYVCCVPINV